MTPKPSKGKQLLPTLAGRLKHPLTSRVEAVRQLQTMIPISDLAQSVLERSSRENDYPAPEIITRARLAEEAITQPVRIAY